MTQHTAEPWRTENGDVVCKEGPIAAVMLPNDRANATRIVACVNACEGINPEAVPELLEALKDMYLGRGHPGDRIDRALAALAKATEVTA